MKKASVQIDKSSYLLGNTYLKSFLTCLVGYLLKLFFAHLSQLLGWSRAVYRLTHNQTRLNWLKRSYPRIHLGLGGIVDDRTPYLTTQKERLNDELSFKSG